MKRTAFSKIPSRKYMRRFNTMQSKGEVVRQSLYDFTTYKAAGQQQLKFFQEPHGGAGGKTLEDTNMEAAGALPAGKQFLIESIQLAFFPGVNPTTAVTTKDNPEFANDVYTVSKSGYLDLFISSKSYLTEAPLGRFPASFSIDVDSAHALEFKQATAADESLVLSTDYARMNGDEYVLNPPVRLVPTQNFSVTLNWNTPQALPSGQDGRIGVILEGILTRNTQ